MNTKQSIKKIKDLLFEIQLSRIKEKAEKNVWFKKNYPNPLQKDELTINMLWYDKAKPIYKKYAKQRGKLVDKVNRIWENTAEMTIEHYEKMFEDEN